MPEGNEIHRFAKLHDATYAGKTICVESPNGRFPGAASLSGRKLKSVIAHGKHLAYDFGRDRKLHIHLGRFGDFTEGKMPYPEVKGVLRMRWSTATDWLELRGATDVSVYTDAQWQAVEARLGPDPLAPAADPSPAIAYIRKANTPIAALLMDQSVFSGIGNIYRAELLYRARQDPFARGKDVSEKTLKAVWRDAINLMSDGMVDRRIVTTRPKDRPHPKGVPQPHEVHYVYRRHGQPCFVCGTTIQRQDLAGRTLYSCPTCQAPSDKQTVATPSAPSSTRKRRSTTTETRP